MDICEERVLSYPAHYTPVTPIDDSLWKIKWRRKGILHVYLQERNLNMSKDTIWMLETTLSDTGFISYVVFLLLRLCKYSQIHLLERFSSSLLSMHGNQGWNEILKFFFFFKKELTPFDLAKYMTCSIFKLMTQRHQARYLLGTWDNVNFGGRKCCLREAIMQWKVPLGWESGNLESNLYSTTF